MSRNNRMKGKGPKPLQVSSFAFILYQLRYNRTVFGRSMFQGSFDDSARLLLNHFGKGLPQILVLRTSSGPKAPLSRIRRNRRRPNDQISTIVRIRFGSLWRETTCIDRVPRTHRRSSDLKSTCNVTPSKLTLFYDGSCPLCASEIGYYKRADRDRALDFIDVSSDQFSGDDRINRTDAMARFHVRLADGRQVSGARAFVEVWQLIPSWRWLARLASLPGAERVLEALYRLFLKARPIIVWGFSKLQKLTGRTS